MANADWVATRDQIIKAAIRKVSSNDPGQQIDPTEIDEAAFQLNAMVKSWQVDVDLWKREEYIVPITSGTTKYFLGPSAGAAKVFTTPDRGGQLIQETTLSGAYTASDDHISPGSNLGVAVGDFVGFQLDDDSWHWATVDSLESPTAGDVGIDTVVASAAAAGNKVLLFAATGNRPQRILSGVRVSTSNITTPLSIISRDEYMRLSSPSITGAVTQIHYSPQRETGELLVWPTGDSNYPYLKLIVHVLLEDMDTAAAEPDFPVEWQNALIWGLAAEMVDEYDHVTPNKAARIFAMARAKYEDVLNYDTGDASVSFVMSEARG